MTLYIILYQTLLTLLMPLGLLFWGVKMCTGERYRKGWRERLGLYGRRAGPSLWVHGASVGEINAVSPLIKELLRREQRLTITTTSVTGRARAAQLVGKGGRARLLPIDYLPFLMLAFRSVNPTALVIAETELWPALFWYAHKKRVPLVIVSGRISDRTFPRYRKMKRHVGQLLSLAHTIHAQTQLDAERFMLLGARANSVFVGGNMKYDIATVDTSDSLPIALRRCRAGGWRVLVAGSVHPGEAAILGEGVALARKNTERLALVVAPRHPEKVEEVERELRSCGHEIIRYSELGRPLEATFMESFEKGKTIVIDRMGLLARIYGGAEVAFVGGSLVPVGGHSLLEPLAWGVPTLFGPYMDSAAEIRDELLSRGLGQQVNDAESFSIVVSAWLDNPRALETIREKSRELFEQNRGALNRALEALSAAGVLGAAHGQSADKAVDGGVD